MRSVSEQQGKIALDARESWQRLIAPRFFRRAHGGVNRIEFQLREKYVLPQFQFFRDTPRELAGYTERREIARFVRTDGVQMDGAAARRVQPLRGAIGPLESAAEFTERIEIALEVGERKIARC